MSVAIKTFKTPPAAAIKALARKDLVPVAKVPEFAAAKPQPRKAVALPGGGVAVLKSKTWW
jgi:hypothetical protein